MEINKIMANLEAKHPGEKEYLQAVHEVLMSIEDIYNQHPEFERAKIIERLVERVLVLEAAFPHPSVFLGLMTKVRCKSILATVYSLIVLLVPIRADCDFMLQSISAS